MPWRSTRTGHSAVSSSASSSCSLWSGGRGRPRRGAARRGRRGRSRGGREHVPGQGDRGSTPPRPPQRGPQRRGVRDIPRGTPRPHRSQRLAMNLLVELERARLGAAPAEGAAVGDPRPHWCPPRARGTAGRAAASVRRAAGSSLVTIRGGSTPRPTSPAAPDPDTVDVPPGSGRDVPVRLRGGFRHEL